MKKVGIFSNRAPVPLGCYSQSLALGPWLFISGQVPLDPKTNSLVSGNIIQQTERVMENIREILRAYKMSFQDVLKTGIFLKDMRHFKEVDNLYKVYFKKPYPARFCVAVSELPGGVDIEIEAQAYKDREEDL